MKVHVRNLFVLLVVLAIALPGSAAQSSKKTVLEALQQDVDNLKKNPGDKALREKILKTAAVMKPAPPLSEDAERHMARGTAFAQKAADTAGHRRAIDEFKAAIQEAPWLPLAYYDLGVVQEKEGLFKEAIQSLKFYLVALPEAKNAREVRNKIYALEADAEAMEAASHQAAPAPAAAKSPRQLGVAGAPALEIEPEKQLKIIKMPYDAKARIPHFEGNWYFKETINGEERIYHAFEISKSANGDLTLIPPLRSAGSYANINTFEIADKKLKIQMKWKMTSSPAYWKIETYVLMLSDDGSRLAGSHNQQSIGGRNIDMDRILFRQ